MNYNKICPICGVEFTSGVYNKKYCSRECINKKNRNIRVQKFNNKEHIVCEICKSKFKQKNKNQKCCTRECSKIYKKKINNIYMASYSLKNKDKISKFSKEYYKKNKNITVKKSSEYYYSNKEYILKRMNESLKKKYKDFIEK